MSFTPDPGPRPGSPAPGSILGGVLADLSVTPYAAILWRLSAERRSGDLQVRSGTFVKTVFLDAGRLVFAASSLIEDRLGESLVEAGRISEQEYEAATLLMQMRKARFGEALVQAGVMGKSELGRSVARQVRKIGVSLFPLTDGAAFFDERECTIPAEYMVNVSLRRLMYEGIRRMGSEPLLRAGLGDLSRKVVVADVPPFRLSVERCTAEERDVLARAHRRISLARLLDEGGGPGIARLRAVYAFFASGVLREETLVAAAPVVQADDEGFLLSALQRRSGSDDHDALRHEVTHDLAASLNDASSWLQVPAEAPVPVVVAQLQDKLERYASLHGQAPEDEVLRSQIETLVGRAWLLLKKHGVVGDEVLFGAVEDAPAPAAAADAPPPESETPAAPGSTAPEPPPVEDMDLELEPEDEPEEAGLEPPEEEPAPSDDAGHAEGPELALGAMAPDASHAPAADAAQAAATASRGKAAAEPEPDPARIEQLLTWSGIQMTIEDYASAVRGYAELVELAPRVAQYRLRLAIAMALLPQTAKRAEREFHEALRLDSNNPDAHYQLAIYYKRMKLRGRAQEQLRLALSINPEHQRARDELEALAPRDSALTSLRKLFK